MARGRGGLVKVMLEKETSLQALKLQRYLQNYLAPQEVYVRFNRNRSTYLSATKKEGKYSLSVHQVFVEAPENIWELLGKFFTRATKNVRFQLEQYVHSLPSEVWQANTRQMPTMEVEGKAHDLQKALHRANELGFQGEFPRELPRIGWTRQGKKKRKNVYRLGSYDDDAHVIRISFRLDDKEVPFDFICSVVFHEMLHAIYRPVISEGKRRRIHTKEFVMAEKQYLHYEWSKNWEKFYLDKILKKQNRRWRFF